MSATAEDDDRSLAQSEIDALLNSNSKAARTDRRGSPRYPYQALQKLTPFSKGIRGDCKPVLCSNLSRSGLAMLLESSPDFDEFHLELRQGSFRVNVRGRVVATQPAADNKILVRCEFIEKVQPSADKKPKSAVA